MSTRSTLAIGAAAGALAVGLGAFGAHALKPMLLETGRLDTYQTAVAYHFYHVFALLATGILMRQNSSRLLGYAATCFCIGIILFSGSLYLICFTGITKAGVVTPVGGLFFIAGWILLLASALKSKGSQ